MTKALGQSRGALSRGPKPLDFIYDNHDLARKAGEKSAMKIYAVAGWGFVGLAVIGAALPVMPTTIFLILAFACFSKSSPEAARKLLEHPRFGPPLRAWQENGAISLSAKVFAVAAMTLSWGIVLYTSANWILPAVVGAILAAVATFVITRPLPPPTSPPQTHQSH